MSSREESLAMADNHARHAAGSRPIPGNQTGGRVLTIITKEFFPWVRSLAERDGESREDGVTEPSSTPWGRPARGHVAVAIILLGTENVGRRRGRRAGLRKGEPVGRYRLGDCWSRAGGGRRPAPGRPRGG